MDRDVDVIVGAVNGCEVFPATMGSYSFFFNLSFHCAILFTFYKGLELMLHEERSFQHTVIPSSVTFSLSPVADYYLFCLHILSTLIYYKTVIWSDLGCCQLIKHIKQRE